MIDKQLQQEIEAVVRARMLPLFAEYHLDPGDLEAVLKWKPMVVILGNYSSGKSTLINEILGMEIQRTGQAPTDDSFTVITALDGNEASHTEIPGATLVNDDNLPFSAFKDYGEQLIAHFQMKRIASPMLQNLAIVDSPGMVDSVTEKGRGYDFPSVVGEFAKLADLVVLMFDPHKAGTIKETYSTIRTTLPETSAEDRIVFVMSRIDECDNLGDLVRSYGTLCWNLSQMTGRKDIPRIYLTFSPDVTRQTKKLEVWVDERNQLKQKILSTPELRISHILHNVDRQVNELKMIVEALANLGRIGRAMATRTLKITSLVATLLFFFTDIILHFLVGWPQTPLLAAFMSGHIIGPHLIMPLLTAMGLYTLAGTWFVKWLMPRQIKKYRLNPDHLASLETDYRRFKWARVKTIIREHLAQATIRDIGFRHQKNLQFINAFIKEDLQRFYAQK